MKLSQVKGNTWVIEANQLIPLYKLGDGRCVLLDTGLFEEREELEETLLSNCLTPAGVLCSHAHVDHCANNGYFQEKYGTKVALTFPEAGMCSSLLTLKCYFLTLSPGTVERESSCMLHTPDVIIPPADGPFSFCGSDFRIVHTPGHSSGHVCTVTPDNVCYTADALLSQELLGAKLPYNLSQEMAIHSREKLRGLDCGAYIMAHRGVCSGGEIGALIDGNQDLIRRRDEYVEEAKKEAERIRRQAEVDAKTIVGESEIARVARDKAREMVTQANDRSKAIINVANEYTDDALRRTEEAIQQALEEVRESRARFRAVSREKLQAQQARPEEQTGGK